MKECLKTAQNDTEFFKAIFKFGDVLKAINASCMDMLYSFYDNPKCFSETFKNLRQHYSPSISAGAFPLYTLTMSEEELADQDAVVDRLVKQGVQRLITDDINRMLTKLGRPTKPAPPTKAMASRENAFHVLIFAAFTLLLFVI